MRLRAILLRLLLCFALVANGTSAVYASTMMAFGAGMDATAAAHDAAPPCDDMPAMAHAAMTSDHDAPASPVAHDDCCPPGACLCSCVSHAPTIPTFGSIAIPVRPSAAPGAALRVSFASPALPHLIRPPIG
ncbi:CopL family metal-binding regulatory protein [Noviluteimonas dokdonensis]|uniref:CopL family metal-binding regulatory protein n=1 Tax=Noviluteimonas dokdonensis TaxID=414050 RepID=UPI00055A8C72|nr:CopL family metal-binding regulatory protein [Lysobacter dokdonensis]